MAKKPKTVKEYIGPQNEDKLRKRFEEFLNSKSGFIIISTNGLKILTTDCYFSVCKGCVLEAVARTVKSADKEGLFSTHSTND